MIQSAEVYLWGRRVGYLYQDSDNNCPSFEYDRDFVKSGIELAPFMMPLSGAVYSFPDLMRTDSFKGLPGLLADSLPDRFGNAVTESWLASHDRSAKSFTAIERLCYTGTRGMGALEFIPSSSPQLPDSDIDISEMVKLASDILNKKTNTGIPADTASLGQMMSIGSSAGGARAKAVLAINEENGIIKSGQINAGPGFDYWLMKFDGVSGSGDHGEEDPGQYTRIEYAYYLMAKDAGIDMTESRLFEKDGRFHFMTKRFDREKGNKIHMQTLSALTHLDYNMPGLCSYEKYADYARRMGLGLRDIRQIYLRMVFCVLACNCDDHVKNFSFLMDRNGRWRLSPAYDMTFAYNPENRWVSGHQMTINGKSRDIDSEDMILAGESMGLTADYCRRCIDSVLDITDNWLSYAERCGIGEERAFLIDDAIKTVGQANEKMGFGPVL